MNAPHIATRPPPSRRAAFPYAIEIATRFMDNDVYGHVNNAVYYALFDTVINRYLIEHGLDVHASAIIGLAAESGCRFHASFAYPELVEARLRIGHLGTSSVRYEVGRDLVDRRRQRDPRSPRSPRDAPGPRSRSTRRLSEPPTIA